MKSSKAYPIIDMVQTGLQLRKYMDSAGMSVKDIQESLHLSCPQPIYRWIKGRILPSVDHLLMLSELFGVHMEDLLVKKQVMITPITCMPNDFSFQKRITTYVKKLKVVLLLTKTACS